jgi:hypothetical protein
MRPPDRVFLDEPLRHFFGENAKALRDLALELVQRHTCLSLQDHVSADALENDFRASRAKRVRIVVLVGAGASAPVLHRGKDLVEALKHTGSFDFDRHRRALERLRFDTEWPRDEFESQLAAMVLTPEEESEVRRALTEIYNVRYPTLLTYELLAHLLKHRYVDALVSFNWDELLDQCLDDELGPNEFVRIVSERDCHGMEFDPDRPGYLPVYLKLHGTARDPETLRFTKQAYYQTPDGMRQAMLDLVGVQRCVLVSLGFGMTSPELPAMLEAPAQLVVYNLAATPIASDAREKLEKGRRANGKVSEFVDICPSLPVAEAAPRPGSGPSDSTDVRVHSTELCLHALVEEVAKAVEGPKPVYFRSIKRHQVVSRLLSWEGRLSERQYLDYLRDRTLLELVFAMVRARGLLSILSLTEDRCGSYYERYRRAAQALNDANVEEWNALCHRVGLEAGYHGHETFVANDDISKPVDPTVRIEHPIYRETLRICDVRKVTERLRKALTYQTSNRFETGAHDRLVVRTDLTRLIESTLEHLQTHTEIEIRTANDRICAKVFSRPKKLTTFSALRAVTISMLENARRFAGPVHIAAVAETGAWLLEHERTLGAIQDEHGLRIDLIVAFATKAAELRAAFPSVEIVRLPWFRHNRHMVVVCLGDTPMEGIYFSRRLRSAFVNPVHVQNDDARSLLQSFVVYAVEAEFRTYEEMAWKRLKALQPQSRVTASLPRNSLDLKEFRMIMRASKARVFGEQGPTPGRATHARLQSAAIRKRRRRSRR